MSEKLVKIIVSEGISTQNNGVNQSNIIINPVFIMRVPFVPTALSLAVTIMTTGIESGNHNIEISILNIEKGSEIYSTGVNLVTINQGTDNFNFNLDLKNLEFMNEGKYLVKYKIEEEINGEKKLTEYEESFFIKANKVLGV